MAAYTTIDDPSAHFQVATYTGNTSAPRNITNDGNSDLKPDLIWGKNRTSAGTNNIITNSTLGFDPATIDSLLSTDSSGTDGTPLNNVQSLIGSTVECWSGEYNNGNNSI